MLESYLLHPSYIIITGDFNIWVDLPDLSEPKRLLKVLSSFNLTQHIHEPTHRSLHTLDLLITRDCENTVSDVSVEPGFSDHSLIICRLNLRKPPRIRKTITTRRYKAIDLSVFSNDVKQSLSKIDLFKCDVLSCVARYEYSLKDLLDTHALPDARSDLALANSFSAFFVGKIDKIRQCFDMTNSNVTSSQITTPILVNMDSFEPTTEDEVM